MIALNHKVSHEVAGFWRNLGKLLGVIGEVGSPYRCINLNASESWDGEASLEAHAVKVNCMNVMRCIQMIMIELYSVL